MPDDTFAVKGNPFFKKTFYSTILSTNIALYQYLAEILFEGDLGRIVWASNELTFRKRQEQVSKRPNTVGILDIPYCSFHLAQDGLENGAQSRPWFNQALNVEGQWIEELGRKVRQTPVQLRYEGVICLQHDTDIYMLQQLLTWITSNEKLLAPTLETKSDSNVTKTIKNIANTKITPHMNTRFSETDWLTNNKIQAIDLDIQIDTYILQDNRQGYWLTRKAVLEFAYEVMPEIVIDVDHPETIEQAVTAQIFN